MKVPEHWLDAEYRAATRAAGRKAARRLRDLGVPLGVLYGLATDFCVYGAGRVETHRSGVFEFSPEGTPAIVQPAARCSVPGEPEIIDLVCWFPDNPNRWWQRTGNGLFLDYDALNRSSFTPNLGVDDDGNPFRQPQPLLVHSSPLDYLRAGCTGTCLLCPDDPGAAFWLSGAEKILCAERELADKVQRVFAVEQTIPDIRFLEESRHAA